MHRIELDIETKACIIDFVAYVWSQYRAQKESCKPDFLIVLIKT